MATLRDTSRDKARAATEWDNMGTSNTGHHRMAGADIASDLWEPLVRDLLKVVHVLCTEDELTLEEDELLDNTYARAREALDE